MKRKFISSISSVAATMFLIGSSLVYAAESNYEDFTQPEGSTTIRIVHTNDLHGRLVSGNNVIGIDTVAAIYRATENAILVDAGDTIHGLPFVTFNQGANAVQLMNEAGFSVFTPGNHDFNYGIDRLLALEEVAQFDFIAANLENEDGTIVFREYSIHEIDGVTIGFFGLAYPGTPTVTNPRNVVGLNFTDPVEAARRNVAYLQNHNVDVIVGISHLGVNGRAWGREVARQVQEIDILVDGHSHTLFEDGYWVEDVLVVQTGAHGAHVGIVEITLYNDEIINRSATVINREQSEQFLAQNEITETINSMEEDLSLVLDVVVAHSPVTLYGDSDYHRIYLRSEEVPIGNLVADAARWYMETDLAITNSGGIRTHIHEGEVTQGDIINVLAFFNYYVVVEVTPYILWQALENGVSALPGSGRFPQVSGFRFEFDPDKEEGSRVHTVVLADGTHLNQFDQDTTFSLAINNFMYVGGDDYTVFEELSSIAQGSTQDQGLIAFMNEHDISEIGVEGRIVRSVAPEEVTGQEANQIVELVPLRDELYRIGIQDITWNEANRSITIETDESYVVVVIDNYSITIDGETVTLSKAPVLINSVTYISSEFLDLLK